MDGNPPTLLTYSNYILCVSKTKDECISNTWQNHENLFQLAISYKIVKNAPFQCIILDVANFEGNLINIKFYYNICEAILLLKPISLRIKNQPVQSGYGPYFHHKYLVFTQNVIYHDFFKIFFIYKCKISFSFVRLLFYIIFLFNFKKV